MWGSWFGVTVGGLFVVLLIVGIAFGTSALLIPVILAAVILAGAAVVYVMRAGARGAAESGPETDPVRNAAPASSDQGASGYTDPRQI